MRTTSSKNLPDMWKATYDLVAQVPEGMVTTYGEVARALGDVAASRFVGLAMSRNEDIQRVPCRRVVQSDGTLGGYTGGIQSKKSLLRKEGVRVTGVRIVDFEQILFTDFDTDRPLATLRARQKKLREKLTLEDPSWQMSRVAGVDVSYADEHAFAAMVTFDAISGREVDSRVVEGYARFPYIPSYLAFREIPVVESLMRDIGDETVVMYDGNGILHPEGFGIASQVGVEFDVPTIGVAKSLLCGKVRGPLRRTVRSVVFNGRTVGHALAASQTATPIYVSPGHRITCRTAVDVASKFLRHRVPEPTRAAHILAGTAKRAKSNK